VASRSSTRSRLETLSDTSTPAILLAEYAQQTRGEIFGGGNHGQPELTLLQPFHIRHDHFEVGQVIGNASAGPMQFMPDFGEVDLLPHLLEQRHPDRIRQFLDLHRHRGLGSGTTLLQRA